MWEPPVGIKFPGYHYNFIDFCMVHNGKLFDVRLVGSNLNSVVRLILNDQELY